MFNSFDIEVELFIKLLLLRIIRWITKSTILFLFVESCEVPEDFSLFSVSLFFESLCQVEQCKTFSRISLVTLFLVVIFQRNLEAIPSKTV